MPDPAPVTVAAFYRFAEVRDPGALRAAVEPLCRELALRGTLLIAREGLNGTLAGPRAGIDAVLARLRAEPGFAALAPRLSESPAMPFVRLKVRVKREIVTMGTPGAAPAHGTGTRVAPADWNALIADPDVAVIDVRNGYEVGLGSFEGATDPATARFRDFPGWWRDNRARLDGRTVAMFCTGGIRCEKASAYLLQNGAADVRQLDGGILRYLAEVPEADSLWRGRCFVFDGRVSVGHGLVPGPDSPCHGCRAPLTPADRARDDYEPGVACRHCVGARSAEDRARFRERQRQIALARARGERHLGAG